uniref:Uncharacterized protein n=1 Tax=Clandestinovirus TaxID=2831644 RepID=A0A8F8PJY3_9VIRU|nr:hypothetical protein KOM_12_174 [Clandestinovirus]
MFKSVGATLSKRLLLKTTQRRPLCNTKPNDQVKVDVPDPKQELYMDYGFNSGLWIGGAYGLSIGYQEEEDVMTNIGKCLITTPICTFVGCMFGGMLGRALYAVSPCKPCLLGIGMIGAGTVTLYIRDYIGMRALNNFGRF